MTVGDLLFRLRDIDPKTPVILQQDAEGNGYEQCAGADRVKYNPKWKEVVEDDEEGVEVIVLWP